MRAAALRNSLALCVAVAVGFFGCGSAQASQGSKSLQRALHEAWIYFDAGNLREAESGFKRALDLPGGEAER